MAIGSRSSTLHFSVGNSLVGMQIETPTLPPLGWVSYIISLRMSIRMSVAMYVYPTMCHSCHRQKGKAKAFQGVRHSEVDLF